MGATLVEAFIGRVSDGGSIPPASTFAPGTVRAFCYCGRMKLRTKSVLLVAFVFAVVLGVSYAMFTVLRDDITSGLGVTYVERQVMFKRQDILYPLGRELALARKMADSSVLEDWARNEEAPDLRALGLRELEDYRRFFRDRSYFFAVASSGNYYFNDSRGSRTDDPLAYTLDPSDPEDQWFFRTLPGPEPYRLNVDFDEKLGVAKVWLNVVLSDGTEPLGVLGTGLELTDFLQSVVAADRPGVTNAVLDGEGAIQAHTDVELIDYRSISKTPEERTTFFGLLDSSQDQNRLAHLMSGLREEGDERVASFVGSVDGVEYLIGVGYVEELDWFVVSMLDTAQIIGVQRFVPLAVLLLGALIVLSAAIVLLLNRVVFSRILQLDAKVREFTAELEPSSLTLQKSGDEMGRLEQAFQRMAEEVKAYTVELEDEIRTLSGLLPTCMHCKKIRDENGDWVRMEEYISSRSGAKFSHGICPECLEREYGDS
ncbi:MAG: hypothetical protein Kow00129_06530 [Thermoleophilia bacterium]